MESRKHSSSPDPCRVTVTIATRHLESWHQGFCLVLPSISWAVQGASLQVLRTLFPRMVLSCAWEGCPRPSGPRSSASFFSQLSPVWCSDFRPGRRRGEGAFGFLASYFFQKVLLIYFHGFVASAPPSFKKQGCLVKGYAYFNAFDILILNSVPVYTPANFLGLLPFANLSLCLMVR